MVAPVSLDAIVLLGCRVEADGRIKLLGIGDTGHIPANLTTAASGDPAGRLVPAALKEAVTE